MAEPDSDQAKHDRSHHIGGGLWPIPIAHQIESLQAKRGKRGETAAQAGDHKLPGFQITPEPPI